jgi:hypothetical protein
MRVCFIVTHDLTALQFLQMSVALLAGLKCSGAPYGIVLLDTKPFLQARIWLNIELYSYDPTSGIGESTPRRALADTTFLLASALDDSGLSPHVNVPVVF